MSARSVHEAAVEAMAGALCDSRGHAFVIQFGRACPRCVGVARKQNAALVASAEVREGLVAALPSSAEYLADAMLAALAGTEATS